MTMTAAPIPTVDCATLPESQPQPAIGPALPRSVLVQASDLAEPWGSFADYPDGGRSPGSGPSRMQVSDSLSTTDTDPAWSLSTEAEEFGSAADAAAWFTAAGLGAACRSDGYTIKSGAGQVPPSSSEILANTIRDGARVLIAHRTSTQQPPEWAVIVLVGERGVVTTVTPLNARTQLGLTNDWLDALASAMLARLTGVTPRTLPGIAAYAKPTHVPAGFLLPGDIGPDWQIWSPSTDMGPIPGGNSSLPDPAHCTRTVAYATVGAEVYQGYRDTTGTTIYEDVITFAPGQAARYLAAMRSGLGSCKSGMTSMTPLPGFGDEAYATESEAGPQVLVRQDDTLLRLNATPQLDGGSDTLTRLARTALDRRS
ncbi:hypothetical protein [Motilibacter peucedani]|uniref:hypothetical protein n=1 Tax=Motilibacter peucedani TaxID=598650 RepID=UPI0011C479FA|nr:hypothetical protein [Motilibacter peucedani]